MVETVFTDEDKKNLKVIAEELPKLRIVVEELMETLEITLHIVKKQIKF